MAVKSICIHCSKAIVSITPHVWVSESKLEPQHCYNDPIAGNQLHEPPVGVLGHLPMKK